jgi:hypothetical protein
MRTPYPIDVDGELRYDAYAMMAVMGGNPLMRLQPHAYALLLFTWFAAGCGKSDANDGAGTTSTGASMTTSSTTSTTSTTTMTPPDVPPGTGMGTCALDNAAFCETFDMPSPGGRAGDLDDAKWSAARISTVNNQGQGEYNEWGSVTTYGCGKTTPRVLVPSDMFFCMNPKTGSMQFNDGQNDLGGFTIHSDRIRQPFDFANRTGIISLDVSGKGALPGGHGFWFNIFIADEPVPAPYQDGQAIALYAKGGVGIEFESASCSDDSTSNTITHIFVEKDYAFQQQIAAPPGSPCFKTQEDLMNRLEVHINQSKIEVFVSDAGDPKSLRRVMVADNLSLPFTRGYVSIQNTHYNASKCTFTDKNCTDCSAHCPTFPADATYHWDNVGFDGPVLPTPRGYEIPDNTAKSSEPDKSVTFPGPYVNTGYLLGTDGMPAERRGFLAGDGPAAPLTIKGVDLTNATDAVLTFNAWAFCDKVTVKYRFNGGTWRSVKHPFPDCDEGARAVAVPIDLADLKQGDNTLEMFTDTGKQDFIGVIVANGELTINVK